MSTTADEPRVAEPRPEARNDPEALIREARLRQRRRRLRILATVLALAATAGAAYGVLHGTGDGAQAVEHVPNGPTVAVRAFSSHGLLAFVSRGRLWLLNGETGKLHAVASPGVTPSRPMFSPDGQWLAYLEQQRGPATDHFQLWLARADGSDAHAVPDLEVYRLVGWSPTRDLLAVAAGPERTSRPCPCYSPTTVRLISPDGSSRTLARAPAVYGATWSPDGSRIAVAAIGARVSRLVTYPATGEPVTTWLSVPAARKQNGMNGVLFDVAGWWQHLGIGIWVFGDGAVHNSDATPLDAVAAPGAKPRLLGQTLSDGVTDAVAASTGGRVAIVTDHGGGRAAWQGKQVELCGARPRPCRPLPHRRGDVTVDPAWSPDGRTLAYVAAPDVPGGPWTQKTIAAWFAAHRVYLYDAATGRAHELPAARGATAITWAQDGRSFLYVRGDALWLLPTLAGTPVRIATPLFPRGDWPQYYAQIAWSAQFAWTTPH
jgi:hypothetical protein